MNLLRLRGRKICEQLLRKGNVWKGRHMTIRFLPSAPRHPSVDPTKPGVYIGTVASAKLHKSAVKRNRMRRRCREAFRVTLKGRGGIFRPTGSGIFRPYATQLLILPRSSSLTCAFPEILSDIRAFLSVLDAWQKRLPGNSSNSR